MKKNIPLIILGSVLLMFILIFITMQKQTQAKEENWGMADAKEVNINPKVSGRIIKICVEEGSAVKQGDILAYLDKDSQNIERTQTQAALAAQIAQLEQTNITAQNNQQVLNANLQKAEADLVTAQNDEQRYSRLLKKNAVSQQLYENYANKLQAAQSAYDSAKANMLQNDVNKSLLVMRQKQINEIQGKLASVKLSENEAVIRAPFSGIITKKYLEEGALVSPTIPIFSLQDSNDNWVNFKIKETDLEKYKIGQAIKLRGRNNSLILKGKIVAVSRKPDYATIKATNERGEKDIVSFNLKVQVNDERLWPGMRFCLE